MTRIFQWMSEHKNLTVMIVLFIIGIVVGGIIVC